MRSMLRRTTIREIKGSLGRFFAIMAIVALGVGFFSGLKITRQAMVDTVDRFLNEKNFYDFHLLSTLGFEEADIDFFSKEADVDHVEGMYVFDALYSGIGDNEMVLKSHSIPTTINGLRLVTGRMPESAGECVIDSRLGVKPGGKLCLTTSNEGDTRKVFTEQEFLIVGTVDSSYYLNFERGTTSLGTGKVDGFVYFPPETFDCEYYTDVFICFRQDYEIYSSDYQNFIKGKKKVWEEMVGDRADIRYQSILDEAEEELEQGRADLAVGKAELADAENQIAEGREELERQRKEGEAELQLAYRELQEADQALAAGRQEWNAAQESLEKSETELNQQDLILSGQEQTLLDSETEWNAAWQQLAGEQQQLLSQLEQSILQADEAQLAQLQQQWQSAPQMFQLATAHIQIEQGKSAVIQGKQELEAGRNRLEAGKEELAGKEAELRQGELEAEQGWRDYETGRQAFYARIQEAEAELLDAEVELSEAEKDVKAAEAELAEAETELASLEMPDTFVLDRSANIGYACFENDSSIIDAIAKIFPIFFILVAALVCMTTMNRMVEERRTQIGVLKALGYSEAAIMGKFMFYSGSAALIGCIIGYASGIYVFPQVIWKAYGMMYLTMDLSYLFNWGLAGFVLLVSVLCSMGTTYFSCHHEMAETAASLMRAKAPRAGKRVLLEQIPFIWRRLKFLHKVSLRNIFRYKKRLFMMIIGISGCTALLLTGFGIKDSIADFAAMQYEEIQILDGSIGVKAAMDSTTDNTLTRKLDSLTENYAYVSETSWDLTFEENVKSVNLVIPEHPEEIKDYINFHTKKKEPVAFPSDGQAVINSGLADRFHIEVGDEIRLRDEAMREIRVTVAGVFENYVYNYVFLSPDTYREAFDEEPEYKTIYVNMKTETDLHLTAAEIMKENQVSFITLHQDTRERLGNMMGSLNYVVVLVIICAAALAFIVLYNLTNINITERIREIATIKVLGFFRKETEAYVFRENMVLTGIGILIGLGFGVLLHHFVINQIQVDMVEFDIRIRPLSYLYSILLTFAFHYCVNWVMSLKLERVNMAESLKSVD